MKKKLLAGLTAVMLVGSASLCFAGVFGSYTSGLGVAHSPHNLPLYLVKAGQPNTTSQICIFCHTPHNAPGSGEAGYNPLWNHKMDTKTFIPYEGVDLKDSEYALAGGYTTFNAVGTITEYDVVKGPSRLCMSCHDGQTALDAYSKNGAGNPLTIPGTADGGMIIAGLAPSPSFVYPTGVKDLRNDHPIGFNYLDVAEGRNGVTKDVNIRPATTNVAGALIGITRTSIGQIKDVLYKSEYLTCSSCHDVHNADGQKVVGGSFGKPFLRVNNEGSSLCLMCHIK